MSPKSFLLTDSVASYLDAHNPPLDDVARSLIEKTQALGDVARMQIAPEQGAFITFLVRLLKPQFAVEVGTFTGFSSLCIARGLPPGGHLLCCDVSDEWTSIARQHWQQAGVADRIELKLGPASATLRALTSEVSVDFAFIDADKTSYRDYYEQLITRLAPRGVILVDNVLWSGRVVTDDNEPDTVAMRTFNDYVTSDPRCHAVMIPVADGLTLIQRA